MRKRQQIPLPFAASKRQTFATFLGRSNDELVTLLGKPQSSNLACWLYGPSGVGKSHLLAATLDAQRGYGRRTEHLCLSKDALPGEGVRADVIAIDHVDARSLGMDEERALVALFQNQVLGGGWLILGASVSPRQMGWQLPDLASRLNSMQTFCVQPLDEGEVRTLLAKRARERGLSLPRPVVDYWLTRRDRSVPALLHDLDRLDEAAWVEQRRLTVPFMKGVLEN